MLFFVVVVVVVVFLSFRDADLFSFFFFFGRSFPFLLFFSSTLLIFSPLPLTQQNRRPVLPDILVRVICWVLGEYAYLKGADAISEVCDQICEVAERSYTTNAATRAYAITAVIKLTAQYGRATTAATTLVLKYANSSNADLQQRCYEFME